MLLPLLSYRLAKPVLLLTAVLLLELTSYGQSRSFDIIIGNNPVGKLSVRQDPSGAHRRIRISSRVQSKFLSRMEVDIEADYQHNVLSRASVVRTQAKPGENREILTEKTDNGYAVTKRGTKTKLSEAAIKFSVADLYFTEPRDINEIYSETLGQMIPIRSLGEGRYDLQLPEGKHNLYTYRKGSLHEVEVNHSLGKAYFRVTGGQ
ncbi:DUF6134 family protein [Chitinophaga lutea]